jgi:large subunit ribosomal protein L22
MLNLAVNPTFLFNLDEKLKIPINYKMMSNAKPSVFGYPKEEEKDTKKKEVKAEAAPAPVKEPRTEARAIATNVRLTPRKARLVIDLVRGKDVKVALGLLANTNKAASEPVSKLIKSAAANAVNNFGMDEDSLYIAQIWANDGLRMKRYLPRAKGSASGLVKRNSHLYVVVKMR